jgi:choline dehydrogenase-like flavoprotein
MKSIRDPWAQAQARGWKLTDGATLTQDLNLVADVVIIGSGAGGGISAELLAARGLSVILLEEGGLKSSRDFHLLESQAYPELYQEAAARKTLDQGIGILQGRTVGGSTTVNWTSCFRTPADTLSWWREQHGLHALSQAEMDPWFERVEQRLGVSDWPIAPNGNNAMLARGCQALGMGFGAVRRNVRACWDLGYCGMGCATNAKQSMLVTCIPAALEHGAHLLTRMRAQTLIFTPGRAAVEALDCQTLAADGMTTRGYRVRIRAQQFVLSAGAIGSPALLLRSGAPDPHALLGRRTFLHPVALSGALRRPSIPTISCIPSRWMAHWAISWRCRRCIPCCWPAPCPVLARRTRP